MKQDDPSLLYECAEPMDRDIHWVYSFVSKNSSDSVEIRSHDAKTEQTLDAAQFSKFKDVNPMKENILKAISEEYIKALCHKKQIRLVYSTGAVLDASFQRSDMLMRKQVKPVVGFKKLFYLQLHVLKHVLGFGRYSPGFTIAQNRDEAIKQYESLYRPILQENFPGRLDSWQDYFNRLQKVPCEFITQVEAFSDFEAAKDDHATRKCRAPRHVARCRNAIWDLSEAYSEWIMSQMESALSKFDNHGGHLHITQNGKENIYTWVNHRSVIMAEEDDDGKEIVVRTSFVPTNKEFDAQNTHKDLKNYVIKKMFAGLSEYPIIHPSRDI